MMLARVETNIGMTDQTIPGRWSSKVELEKNMSGKALNGWALQGNFKLDSARHLVAQGSVFHDRETQNPQGLNGTRK
jgi:hypothetical protein